MTKFNSKSSKNIECIQYKHPGSESGKIDSTVNTQIQRNLTFINSSDTQKTADFSFCLEFNNINDLSSFVLKSKQVNLVYLLLVGADKLQSAPKIHNLIENQEDFISCKIFIPKSSTPPYTSPLQLLTISSFWDNLLNVYFQNFYEAVPIFSIAYFDPKTAPAYLMAAIYYAGYKSQPDQPEEITAYMENHAKANLKLLIRQCSLPAIQALLVYVIVYYREGNMPLHFTCRAHATRIGYALGVHLDNKIFSKLEKYNRELALIKLRGINIVGTSSDNLSVNFLTEFGSFNIKPIEPEWQTMNISSVICYEDENERLLYGVCCAHFINLSNEFKHSIHSSLFNNTRDSRYKYEWNKTRRAVARIYKKYIIFYQSLNSINPSYAHITSKYEFKVYLLYHDIMIDMYSKLVNKMEDLNSSDIDDAVCHIDWMLKHILLLNQPNIPTQTGIALLGYHYLKLYKLCNSHTRKAIQTKLTQIIQALSIYYTPSNALSFIILKKGYKLIVEDGNN